MVTSATKAFVIGVVAGGVALVLSYGLRIFAGGLFIPESASQALFSLTPGSLESTAVADLGALAKYTTFAGAIIANFILYGLIAILGVSLYRKSY